MNAAKPSAHADLLEATLVAVVRDEDGERALRIARALLAGGLKALEITANTPGCFDSLRALGALAEQSGARLGVGTVRTQEQVEAAAAAGATFTVSPHTDPHLVEAALARGLVPIPGAATATEVLSARRAGAELVKLFPISALGGPRFVRLLRGPLPDVLFWVSGDVAIDEVPAYLDAGARLVGLTSALTAGLPAEGLEAAVEARARAARVALERARASAPLFTVRVGGSAFGVGRDQLARLPDEEHVALEHAIPGRRGQAVRARALLATLGVPQDATLRLASLDGSSRELSAGALHDGGLLHFATDGLPLSREAGGPVRLYLLGGQDRCDNLKGLSQIEVV
jgi:2-dehydro-3-deoxyphosphogluconate aldolase/(4S)-4-hydroxy-2-oxoglutarate aldolase